MRERICRLPHVMFRSLTGMQLTYNTESLQCAARRLGACGLGARVHWEAVTTVRFLAASTTSRNYLFRVVRTFTTHSLGN